MPRQLRQKFLNMRGGKKFTTVDEYMSDLEPAQKKTLEGLRKTIQKAAPKAEELISYNIPAFKFHGQLVFYAAYNDHISFFPTSSGISNFKNELSAYDIAKGTVRFPVDKPLPLKLIAEIVKFRVLENLERAQSKAKKKK
jgi:uncharacterized protein YdhG (YjbR/CyaY superfamily)